MAAHNLTDEDILRRLAVWREHGENQSDAALALDISRPAIQHTIREAKRRGLFDMAPDDLPEVAMPTWVDDDIPAEEIIEHMSRRFQKQAAARAQKKWFPVQVRERKPFAIAFWGDPHLGVHCNWPLLRRDVEIAATTPGLYSINLGDTADNWGGRLMRLYAQDDISKPTERTLARWFLKDSGVKWLLWLMGNHDTMDDGFAVYLKTIGGKSFLMEDWRARFVIQCGEHEWKIDAAHNHKGHSQFNPLHGQRRVLAFEEEADLVISGHHHDWGVFQMELPSGRVATLARARGYKFNDDFAHRHQFHEHQHGSSLITVFDPTAQGPSRMVTFADLELGARYLTWLREG